MKTNQNGSSGTKAVPTAVISIAPITLKAPGRLVDLQLRISAPQTGKKLPIVLLSHGHGMSNHMSSLNGNLPMSDYWAAAGFIVIAPTHLDSKTLALDSSTDGYPLFWRSRAEDMKFIIDNLDQLEELAPELKGRMDHSKIAATGISMGGHTASLLLGSQLIDPESKKVVDLKDSRIMGGILISAPGNGNGGAALTPMAIEKYSFFKDSDLSKMTTKALIVAGDKDASAHLNTVGPVWHTDAYHLSPSPKSLVTVFGGEHLLGGITGYDAAETSDENPERLNFVQKMTTAYLTSLFNPEDKTWQTEVDALKNESKAQGKVESK